MNRTQAAPELSGNTPILLDALNYSPWLVFAVAIAFAILLATSTWVVRQALNYAGIEPPPKTEDTGRAIGKTENVLVLSLILVEAYTALGVIFAAKSIVRKSDMDQQDTSYYLTGTMANFTYSVVVGLLLHTFLWSLVTLDLIG